MTNFYFTCGQIHSHNLENGKVWDKDSLVAVLAPSEDAAVRFVCEKFGYKLAGVYDRLPGLEFAKNGVVESFTA